MEKGREKKHGKYLIQKQQKKTRKGGKKERGHQLNHSTTKVFVLDRNRGGRKGGEKRQGRKGEKEHIGKGSVWESKHQERSFVSLVLSFFFSSIGRGFSRGHDSETPRGRITTHQQTTTQTNLLSLLSFFVPCLREGVGREGEQKHKRKENKKKRQKKKK